MKLSEVMKALDLELLTEGADLEREITKVFASDMMSDVLAFAGDCDLLVTGLCNPQSVRTAEMMDIGTILLVRGKRPDEAMLAVAEDLGVCLLTTKKLMFGSCVALSELGICGGGKNV